MQATATLPDYPAHELVLKVVPETPFNTERGDNYHVPKEAGLQEEVIIMLREQEVRSAGSCSMIAPQGNKGYLIT